MQENNRGIYGCGCKALGEYRGMQGNARGMYGSGCKVPGKYRVMPGELMRVGAVSGMLGNTGECQGNVSEWV